MKSLEITGYRIQRKLAESDSSRVYEALQVSLERIVALKVLKPSMAGKPAEIARFKLQGGATLNLRHANIVQTYVSSESQGVYFHVRELVEGRQLGQVIPRHRGLPLDQTIRIMDAVVSALQAAWEHDGTIHADLKPENILLANDGTVKLTDFSGLTKESSPSLLPALAGTRMGSPSYSPPELARGPKSIDFRVDIYSLGAILYHMLTGHTPFGKLRPAIRAEAHCNDYLKNPLDIDRRKSTAASTLCQKMMVKDPDGRYASWDDIKADLAAVAARRIPPRGSLDSYESCVMDYEGSTGKSRMILIERIKFAVIYIFIALFALLNIYLIAELGGYSGGDREQTPPTRLKGDEK